MKHRSIALPRCTRSVLRQSRRRRAIQPPPAPGPATGLADSAALRATVFGTPPQDIAPLPAESAAARDGPRAAVAAAGSGDLLVRQAAAGVVFGAEKAGAARHRHLRHRQRRQHGEALRRCAPCSTAPVITCSPCRRRPSRASSSPPRAPGVAGDLDAGRAGSVRRDAARSSRICRARCGSPTSICSATASAARMRPIVKSIDDVEHKLHIHRALMINPPVSLFASVGRLDKLYAVIARQRRCGDRALLSAALRGARQSLPRIGPGASSTRISCLVRAASVLEDGRAILRRHRADLSHRAVERISSPATCIPARAWSSIRRIRPRWAIRWRRSRGCLRSKPFSEYFTRIFAPYYLKRRPNRHGRFADRAEPARCHRRAAARGPGLLSPRPTAMT